MTAVVVRVAQKCFFLKCEGIDISFCLSHTLLGEVTGIAGGKQGISLFYQGQPQYSFLLVILHSIYLHSIYLCFHTLQSFLRRPGECSYEVVRVVLCSIFGGAF